MSAKPSFQAPKTGNKAERAATQPAGEVPNGIKATHRHDAGAMARCSYCRRYSLDPNTLGEDRYQPICECGKQHGWCGSFTRPGPDAKWSGAAPISEDTPSIEIRNGVPYDTGTGLQYDDTPAAPSVTEGDALPPLPKPDCYYVKDGTDHEYNTIEEFSGGRRKGVALYTADQMRAYVLADRAARTVNASIGEDPEFHRLLDIHADDEQGRMRTRRDIVDYIDVRTQPAAVEPAAPERSETLADEQILLPADLAALKRFHECAMDFDSGGHDVPRPAMSRLTEIGVCRHVGFGNHQTTAFGDFVLARSEGESINLPLKTLQERNADAAIAAKGK